MPQIVIVASLPTTWAATISTASGITGLTLPGMIELPGCRLGIEISPMPQRGPEASQRTSLAILVSEAGSVLKAPAVSPAGSLPPRAPNRSGPGAKAEPARSDSPELTLPPQPGVAL